MSKTILAQVNGFTPLIDGIVGELGIITAAVFGKIWRYCQMSDNVCKASQQRIADELGLSRVAVNTHINTLVENGYLVDTTPDLVGVPHIYADTGKANLSISFTAFSPTCKANLQPPVNEIDTKIVSKKEKDICDAAKTAAPRQRLGDALDGMIAFGADAQRTGLIGDRINQFPADVQDTLRDLVRLWAWPTVPARPARSSSGGEFALWIRDLREINTLIAGHGPDALKAAYSRWSEKQFTVSHPGALTRTVFAAVADLNKRKNAASSQTDFTGYGNAILPDGSKKPSPRPTRESLGLTQNAVRS